MKLTQLKQLEQESLQRGIPIIGHEKGTWLYHKIQELKPKKILELGTANGYSGCILGSTGAVLIAIELDEERAAEARENFQKFEINAEVRVDNGVAVLTELVVDKANLESFDIIFIDFAKKKYNEVLDNCLKLVKKGGYIIADNITAIGCQDFKKRVFAVPHLQTELVNIKDGLSCSKKSS